MKYFTLLLIPLFLLASCTSSQGYLKKGQYDAAINKSVKKLMKKPTNTKEIDVLREALRIANDNDTRRIDFLRKSGQPHIWDEVFQRYNALKNRQEVIRRLPISVQNAINFTEKDYDLEIIEAQKKAAAYFYARGEELLARGDKMSARQAFDNFNSVKRYFSAYRDVDQKINEAKYIGTNFILFRYVNESGILIPQNFDNELKRISLQELNRQWIEYHTQEVKDLDYDYMISLKLKMIDVSPEQVKETVYEEKKEVQDGWIYALDPNGNVAKDSLGNDIKHPKMVTLRAEIIETRLFKQAIVSGILEFRNVKTGQVIKTDPVTAESTFEHFTARVNGDMKAVSAETKKKLNSRPAPFPSDPEMIFRTNETLKNMTKEIIRRNKNLVEF